MGAYLSEPVTEKISSDETSSRVSYGASSMQGWRVAQEDAHTCIVDFDENASLFAVYDGHGGAEVAQYCANHLQDVIRKTEAYKSGNMGQALEDAFLQLDASLIQKEVLEELKAMAGDVGDQSEEGDENEVDNLYAEADMPLEELLAKYRSNPGVSPNTKYLKREKRDSFLRPNPNDGTGPSCSSACFVGDQISIQPSTTASAASSSSAPVEKPETSSVAKCAGDAVLNGIENDDVTAKGDIEIDQKSDSKPSEKIEEVKPSAEIAADVDELVNGASTTESVLPTPSSVSKDKGKSLKKRGVMGVKFSKGDVMATCSKILTPILRKHGVQPRMIDDDDGSEESDDSDDEYDATHGSSVDNGDEDDDDDDDDGEEVDDGGDDDDDDDDDQEENSDEEDDEEGSEFMMSEKEEPGFDSGCTAVVALLKNNEVYVANAGDSRCVICRCGKAIEMSRDHKPEDDLERQRIEKAGGTVTDDGRVNGGLNLSRAIGDHSYKRNEALPPREQMISAQPDIRTLTIDPLEDEFMVIACDGIWNFMNSQEVVDFVRERMPKQTDNKFSSICEELFDKCLSPTTIGDGTGCDNMTCIIVKFHDLPTSAKNSTAIKRSSNDMVSEETADSSHHSKRVKLEAD